MYAALAGVVVASPLPNASWFSAAESALGALYALHPTPEHVAGALLRTLAKRAFAAQPADGMEGVEEGAAGPGEGGAEAVTQGSAGASYSASALARFFFVLGHVALQHLVRPAAAGAPACWAGRPAGTAPAAPNRTPNPPAPPCRCMWSAWQRRCVAGARMQRRRRPRTVQSAWLLGAPQVRSGELGGERSGQTSAPAAC